MLLFLIVIGPSSHYFSPSGQCVLSIAPRSELVRGVLVSQRLHASVALVLVLLLLLRLFILLFFYSLLPPSNKRFASFSCSPAIVLSFCFFFHSPVAELITIDRIWEKKRSCIAFFLAWLVGFLSFLRWFQLAALSFLPSCQLLQRKVLDLSTSRIFQFSMVSSSLLLPLSCCCSPWCSLPSHLLLPRYSFVGCTCFFQHYRIFSFSICPTESQRG